jgi:hypothetical protein
LLLTASARAARPLLALAALVPAVALAQRDTTRDALSRLEEALTIGLEDKALRPKELLPALVVSVQPAFEETRAWYPTEALATLVRVFGAEGLRACEACMASRLRVAGGRLDQRLGDPDVAELIGLDEAGRGKAEPARTAIWLDETPQGVAVRILDLKNSRLLYAQNLDPRLGEQARVTANVRLARELERRARGDALTHTFVDLVLFPGQHISLDWTEQWGDTNANLSGFSVSVYDPVIGAGGCYYRVIPEAWNLTVGAKVLVSIPTALIQAFTQGGTAQVFDPLLTGVLVVRLPLFGSNWAVTATLSTNLRVGIGVSLLNVSLLPFLP